jgi:hypothetical protein
MQLTINEKCYVNIAMGLPTSVWIPIKYYDPSYYFRKNDLRDFILFSLKKCGWKVEIEEPVLSQDEEFVIVKINKYL